MRSEQYFPARRIDGEIYLSIADLDGLHRAIGLRIVLTKKAPTGDEMRFLRNELDMSQSDLGKIIGVSDQSIARWEKSQTDIPGPAVFSVKFLYLFALMPAEDRSELGSALINLAMELGQADEISDRMEFTFAGAHWVNAAP